MLVSAGDNLSLFAKAAANMGRNQLGSSIFDGHGFLAFRITGFDVVFAGACS